MKRQIKVTIQYSFSISGCWVKRPFARMKRYRYRILGYYIDFFIKLCSYTETCNRSSPYPFITAIMEPLLLQQEHIYEVKSFFPLFFSALLASLSSLLHLLWRYLRPQVKHTSLQRYKYLLSFFFLPRFFSFLYFYKLVFFPKFFK